MKLGSNASFRGADLIINIAAQISNAVSFRIQMTMDYLTKIWISDNLVMFMKH